MPRLIFISMFRRQNLHVLEALAHSSQTLRSENWERRNVSSWKLFPSTPGYRLNKDTLFGSMKTGVKGAQRTAVWRTMTVARSSTAIHGGAAALAPSHVFTHSWNAAVVWQVYQWLDILSVTTKNRKHWQIYLFYSMISVYVLICMAALKVSACLITSFKFV